MAGSIVNGLFAKTPDSPNRAHSEVSPTTGIIAAGDFLIDVPARRATLRGQELDLTSAEF